MEQLVLVYCLHSLREIRLASPHRLDLSFSYTLELGQRLVIPSIHLLSCLTLLHILVFLNSMAMKSGVLPVLLG